MVLVLLRCNVGTEILSGLLDTGAISGLGIQPRSTLGRILTPAPCHHQIHPHHAHVRPEMDADSIPPLSPLGAITARQDQLPPIVIVLLGRRFHTLDPSSSTLGRSFTPALPAQHYHQPIGHPSIISPLLIPRKLLPQQHIIDLDP